MWDWLFEFEFLLFGVFIFLDWCLWLVEGVKLELLFSKVLFLFFFFDLCVLGNINCCMVFDELFSFGGVFSLGSYVFEVCGDDGMGFEFFEFVGYVDVVFVWFSDIWIFWIFCFNCEVLFFFLFGWIRKLMGVCFEWVWWLYVVVFDGGVCVGVGEDVSVIYLGVFFWLFNVFELKGFVGVGLDKEFL